MDCGLMINFCELMLNLGVFIGILGHIGLIIFLIIVFKDD